MFKKLSPTLFWLADNCHISDFCNNDNWIMKLNMSFHNGAELYDF